jgi:hypothetical protein
MSIQASELVWRKSSVVNDGGTNGNKMGNTISVSGAKNNIFPDVPQAERTAGSFNGTAKYRKMFILVNNGEADGNGNLGLSLIAPKLFIETRTPGQDAVNIFLGDQTDIQSGVTGSENLYGMGELTNTVSGGATSIVVTVENWTDLPIFRNGEKIRISNKTSIIDGGGTEEYHIINGAPSPSGNQITIALTGVLANGYSAGSATKISSIIEPGDVDCTVDGFSNNGSGTFVVAGITTDAIGTIEEDWILTFDTPTTYTVRDSAAASVGSGNVGSDFTPSNPNAGTYFTLLSANFGGAFVGAETIDFSTHPAAIPVWYRRDVPAGASSLSGNSVIVALDGESS